MIRAVSELRKDHTNFAVLLDLLHNQLEYVADPDISANYPLMHDIMRYMTQYPDQFHHPKEDLMFAALTVRHPPVRATVWDLRDGHVALATKGKALLEMLERLVDGALVERDSLISAGRAYVVAQRSHMTAEEDGIFQLADERLLRDDWLVIDRELEHMDDPLFGEIVRNDFVELLDRIKQES